MTDADVARAIREDMARWATSFRRLAEAGPCGTAAGLIAAAKLLDRGAAEPVEPDRSVPGQAGVHSTWSYGPVRPRRPGPYPPSRTAGG